MRCTMKMELKPAKEREKKDEKVKHTIPPTTVTTTKKKNISFCELRGWEFGRAYICVCMCAVCLEDTILDQNS